MANRSGKAEPSTRFGPIEIGGPGVELWDSIQDENDSDPANDLQLEWEARSSLQERMLERNKKFIEGLDGLAKKV